MNPTALYIHWPYCARICPYCDFNVHKLREDEALLPAILKDMTAQRELSGPRTISSVHFGGGTPSLMTADQIAAVLGQAGTLWGLPSGTEIALEANPSFLDAAKITAFRDAGINRLSLGVQTFADQGLSLLGRDHDGATARTLATTALSLIPDTSLDLIFGWRGQDAATWQADLDTALALGAPHISTYQLTIEPGTAFAAHEGRGNSRAVAPDTSADFYDMAITTLTGAGFDHYEVSNFAKPDHRSHHNLAYWRGWDYLGVGPGAHGRLTLDNGRVATITPLHPRDYAANPVPDLAPLTPTDVATESILMGLRTGEGLSLTRIQALTGHTLDATDLEDYLTQDGDRLIATPLGRRVLDTLTQTLIRQLD